MSAPARVNPERIIAPLTYFDRLPYDIEDRATGSFFFSFCITYLAKGNALMALAAGGFAVIATIVDALVRPFLEERLGGRPLGGDSMFYLITTVSLCLNGIAAACFSFSFGGIALSMIGNIALSHLTPLFDAVLWRRTPFVTASHYIFIA